MGKNDIHLKGFPMPSVACLAPRSPGKWENENGAAPLCAVLATVMQLPYAQDEPIPDQSEI